VPASIIDGHIGDRHIRTLFRLPSEIEGAMAETILRRSTAPIVTASGYLGKQSR
jgi:hypothetical protein